MTTRQHLWASVVHSAVVLGLTLAACGGGPRASLTVPESAKPGDLLLEPCTFKAESGEYEADCGSLVVQENDAYLAAEQGDASGLVPLQLLYDLEVPITWVAWGDFYAKSGTDYDPSRDYTTEMDPPDSILGSPFSFLIWSGDLGWPMTSVPDEFHKVHPSDVQTLLVTGSIDTRFPPEFAAEELLPYLTHVQQVVVAEAGHELLDVQPEAVERLLTSFYDTGVADDSLYTYVPVSFQASPSAPALAKIVVGIGILIIAAVIAVTLLTIRWAQRRRTRGQP